MLDIVRRAWRNLVRVPGRTLLLLVVLGAVMALAVTSLAVQAGAQVGLLDAKRNMGNEVRLVPNLSAARRAALSGQAQPTIEPVPDDLVTALSASKYVVQTDRQVTSMAYSPDLTTVEEQQQEPGPAPGFFNMPDLSHYFRVVGNAVPSAVLGSAQAQRELVKGRLYTAEEVAAGTPAAVIDEALAERNNLDLGSEFTLQSRDGSKQVTFTVVGVTRDVTPPTETAEAGSHGGIRMRFQLFGAANQVLVPYTAALSLEDSALGVTSVTFYLDDPAHLDAFRQEAAALGLDPDKYTLSANDFRAEAEAAPFQALEGFARMAVIALVVVGALVVVLLMSLVTRERKLEIGVLRALGASRRSIAGQFIVETLTVCLVALVLGGVIGGFAAQTSAERLLAREVSAMENSAVGHTAVLPGGISIIERHQPDSTVATPEINVVFGWRQVASLLGIGLTLAAAGSAASVYWSMQMEPAAILTSRS